MNTLYYLRDKTLERACQLYAAAGLLRRELGRSYGTLMTAEDLRAIARQRTEAGALMDTCLDFARYMGTPEALVQVKDITPAPGGEEEKNG